MNNAVYGQTMENLRNWVDVKLVSNEKDYLKWRTKPSCMSQKMFENDLIAIWKSKATLTLNKLAYVSMCIFHLSKVLIYEFHHGYIKNKYDNKSRLLFTDAEGLMYE